MENSLFVDYLGDCLLDIGPQEWGASRGSFAEID